MTSYILDAEHRPVPATFMEWGEWMKGEARRVDATDLPNGYRVSTVFLGIDHNFGFGDDKRPILFETMVFPEGPEGEYQERFCTWDEACAGHANACLKAAEWPAREKEAK